MFELTNEQRRCFGLQPVQPGWEKIELKPSPYDSHTTYAYRDGSTLRKIVLTGYNLFSESEICEQVSEDLQYLLPKTGKGKLVMLSAATVTKRTGIGMCLSYIRHNSGDTYIDLVNQVAQQAYFSNHYEALRCYGRDDFRNWVESWCRETTAEDLSEIAYFAAQPRKHVRFREGDVFRFKLNRRLYGYGRVLVDYNLMRRQKVPFWDILMGKPVACSVYHIATERADVSVEELENLRSLPSGHIMDNALYYGEFQIIGNIPIGETEDYPILYGNSIDARYRALLLQCGKLYLRDDNGTAIHDNFVNHCIGFYLPMALPVLLQCIEAGSNGPYWAQKDRGVRQDLRNPANRAALEQVCAQFDIEPSRLVK